MSDKLERYRREEADLLERLQSIERQAQEAEKILAGHSEIPKASLLNYTSNHETMQRIIEFQRKALAAQGIASAKNEKQQIEIQNLRETGLTMNERLSRMAAHKAEEHKRSRATVKRYMDSHDILAARLENIERFCRWNPEANQMHLDFLQRERQEAERKAAEQRRLTRECEQQERQRQEEQQRREVELAREREQQKAQSSDQRQRGMRMR